MLCSTYLGYNRQGAEQPLLVTGLGVGTGLWLPPGHSNRGTTRWITTHVKRNWRHKPPKGSSSERPLTRTKELTGRYYRLLSDHAATGAYLCNKIIKTPYDRCQWCGRDENRPATTPSSDVEPRPRSGNRCGRTCGWEHPRASRVRTVFGKRRQHLRF